MGVIMKLLLKLISQGSVFLVILHFQVYSLDLSWKNLPALSQSEVVSDSSLTSYLSLYGLDTIGASPIIGTFKSDSFTCVGQIYKPSGISRGTVIFLHGLFDHVGTNVNAIKICLQENYTFAAFDLPGHGLSSGIRGGIGDFSEYATALHNFLCICDTLTNPPQIFIGHSTGCAVALEYITSTTNQPFARIIFLAPLIRTSSYKFSAIGYKFFHSFRTMPRQRFHKSSHDEEAIERLRKDPLQPTVFQMQWAGAYFRWFDHINKVPEQKLPLVVIQGTDDAIVDWKYNLNWFKRKVNGLSIVTINDARHNLLNESSEYRNKCCDTIRAIINAYN